MSRTVIMGGTVVSMEPGQPDGETADVLIENDRITEMGTLGTIAGAEVVAALSRLVLPASVMPMSTPGRPVCAE